MTLAPPDRYREFLDLIFEHQRILHRLCAVYAAEPADREDLYQEMLLQAWRSFASYDGLSRFSTWLYRVALNTALMKRRKESTRRGHVTTSEEVPEPSASTAGPPREDLELLYSCIQQLSKVDRAIICLHLEQHSYDEIADITGLSRGNVSVRLVRIKDRLKRLLTARGYDEDRES